MSEGIDYAWHPPITADRARQIKREGKHFAMRYVSRYRDKTISRDEARTLGSEGIRVGTNFEDEAGRMDRGYDVGRSDAKVSLSQHEAAGGPDWAPVYFSCDTDTSVGPKITAYLKGAASVLGRDRVGIYGSYRVCKKALEDGLVKYAWQTYAWSGGRWEPRAQLQQYRNGVTVAGISSDLDRATVDLKDAGLWLYGEKSDPLAVLTDGERTAVLKHRRAIEQKSRGRTLYWRGQLTAYMLRIRILEGGVPGPGAPRHRHERYEILKRERARSD